MLDRPPSEKKGNHMADTFGNTSTPGAGAEPIVPLGGASSPASLVGAGSGDMASTTGTMGSTGNIEGGSTSGGHTSEARSRFSAALEEAKAGAVALSAEAKERASAYRDQAKERASAYRDQAKTTGGTWSTDAKSKAGDLAYEGKVRASDALSSLSRLVSDNAATVDEKLGSQYGDYVRSAAKTLQDGSDRLNQKSIEELGEDAREFVRSSPGTAVGLAALAGFMFARVLRK
jgi:ElaB/YqjD/DUF883 family membrane-anchored ribosome-binding protein